MNNDLWSILTIVFWWLVNLDWLHVIVNIWLFFLYLNLMQACNDIKDIKDYLENKSNY